MRHATLTALAAGWLLIAPLASPAAAVSIDDLVNLKANGLTDDVLVALIETDGSVFQLTPMDVLDLHRRGLGERVILAMIRTSRPATPVVAAAPPPPAVPVAPIQQTIVQHVAVNQAPDPVVVHVPVAVPVPIAVPIAEPPRPEKPVYWGFGGALRPDAWTPAPGNAARAPASETPVRRR